VESLAARVTAGDVAARAGIRVAEAETALNALAADTLGTLQVSSCTGLACASVGGQAQRARFAATRSLFSYVGPAKPGLACPYVVARGGVRRLHNQVAAMCNVLWYGIIGALLFINLEGHALCVLRGRAQLVGGAAG